MTQQATSIKDLIIIGAGPSGLCCAIEAARYGLDYLVIEKGVLVNSIYHFPTNMTFFSTSDKLEIGQVPFIAHGDKPTRREALEYYRRIAEFWQLHIKLYECVVQLTAEGESHRIYVVETDKARYRTRHVVVATGFYDQPNFMDVPGEDLPKVRHYYDEAHPYIGQKVLVVGAANSACDVALETWYKGAEVTMAIRGAGIYPKVKYWIRPNIENRIKEGSIKAYFHTTVEVIKPKSVVLRTPQGLLEIENDWVLAMTGYRPNYDFLCKLGIAIRQDEARTPVFDPATFESNLPGVYLAGVVQAGLNTSKLFIENTRHHGEVIVRHILSKQKGLSPEVAPRSTAVPHKREQA